MKIFLKIAPVIVALFLLQTNLANAVPNLISYQGVLNDKDGVPLSTTVSMTFQIYDVETGGTPLWNETQSVQVASGVFNVKLGTVQELSSSMFQQDTLFLSVQVASDPEMVPRQQITSSSYSQKSELVGHGGIPIGTVMAWAKSLPGIPVLGGGWVECNGQVLNDPESLLNGQTLPDLNSTGRYLKGGMDTGVLGGASVHAHFSGVGIDNNYMEYGMFGMEDHFSPLGRYYVGDVSFGWDQYGGRTPKSIKTSTENSDPPYYTVIWIIKVK